MGASSGIHGVARSVIDDALRGQVAGFEVLGRRGDAGDGDDIEGVHPAGMRDGHELMRFFEMRGEVRFIGRRPHWTRHAPVRMIRKRRCAAIGQGQMIVVQYPEGFEAGGTARGGSCTPR